MLADLAYHKKKVPSVAIPQNTYIQRKINIYSYISLNYQKVTYFAAIPKLFN
jgi:hypothetical protein